MPTQTCSILYKSVDSVIVWLHKWIQLYSNVSLASDYDFESLTPINVLVDFNICDAILKPP